MRRFAALACALVLLAPARGSGDEPPKAEPPAAPAAPAPPARSTIVGHHVEVSGDVPAEVLEEAALLGDQLVPLLAAHFEAEVPKSARPLRVEIHATQEAFRAAVQAEGGTEADLQHAGGYTPKKTLVSHLWLQDEPFDTRRLVLHELVHQVQDKTFAEFGPGTDTEWHREGLAEHFGWHVRGKNGLEVGRIDAIARNDMTRRIAHAVTNDAMEAWPHATGAKPSGYEESLALVEAFLRSRDADLRARFRKWEREAWRSRDAARRFVTAFEGRREAVEEALRSTWHEREHPWFALGSWDQFEDSIVGEGDFGLLAHGWKAPRGTSTVGPPPELPPGERWTARARLVGGTGSAALECELGKVASLRLQRWPGWVKLVLDLRGAKPVPLAWWELTDPAPKTIEFEWNESATGMSAIVTIGSTVHRHQVPWQEIDVGLANASSRRDLQGRLFVWGGRQVFEGVLMSR